MRLWLRYKKRRKEWWTHDVESLIEDKKGSYN
jgi:hypothetical protein